MISALAHWASSFLLLLGLSCSILLAIIVSRMLWRKDFVFLKTGTIGNGEPIWPNLVLRWSAVTVVAMTVVTLSGVTGYAIRDLQMYRHTYVLSDLTIKAQLSDDEYIMEFDDTHTAFQTRFCRDYLPPFRVGLRLRELVYEDRGVCWSVSASGKHGYILRR